MLQAISSSVGRRTSWSATTLVARCLSEASKTTPVDTSKEPSGIVLDPATTKIDAHRRYIQAKSSVTPTGFGDVIGKGTKDLHIPKNLTEMAATFSGMPAEHARRPVVIAPRMHKTVQSAERISHIWQITWEHEERWMNPLMGWTSSADPMSNVRLPFDSKEDAIAFAERNGWKYKLRAATEMQDASNYGKIKYSQVFLSNKISQAIKEDSRMGKKIFAYPGYGSSNFFKPLNYHGDGIVEQFGPKAPSQKDSNVSKEYTHAEKDKAGQRWDPRA